MLPPARLLEAGELGARLHPIDRAVMVLRLADPGDQDPATLPIAERDRRLARLQREMFGDAMPCVVHCPHCDAEQEFDLSATLLLDMLGPSPSAETISRDGWDISLRALDSHDLAAAARERGLHDASEILLRRAVVAVTGPSGNVGFDALPADMRDAVSERVGEREAGGDIALDLTCVACAETWTAAFDIAPYLWVEIDAAGRQLLGEVAALAERFGWSEAELLHMSAARRRAYLATETRP